MRMRILSIFVILFLIGAFQGAVMGHSKKIKRTPEILKASKPPRIDGKLDDWSRTASITGYQTPDSPETGGSPKPKDEKDFSFEMFALWDANNMYFAGEMVDDKAELKNNSDRPWNRTADWVELYMDPLNKGGGQRYIGISFGIINGDKPVAYQSDPNEILCADFDVALAPADKLGPKDLPGWIYEARVGKPSWAASGINLSAGQLFGYLTIPGDQDGNDRKRMSWPPFEKIDAENYADLILSDKLATSPVEARGKLAIAWGRLKARD